MIGHLPRSTVMLTALVAALVFATTLAWATSAQSKPVSKGKTVKIQVLSTNDFRRR
jgi:hypothetical protein